MRRTVTKIVLSFTNTTRTPVAWTELDCGHAGKLETRESVQWLNPHHPKNQITKVGDATECTDCDRYVANLERLRTLDRSTLSHSRFRHRDSRGFGPGDVYVYIKDALSPTRCRLFMTIEETPEVHRILSEMQASPLSPTERR